jgi:hypothetical protein
MALFRDRVVETPVMCSLIRTKLLQLEALEWFMRVMTVVQSLLVLARLRALLSSERFEMY